MLSYEIHVKRSLSGWIVGDCGGVAGLWEIVGVVGDCGRLWGEDTRVGGGPFSLSFNGRPIDLVGHGIRSCRVVSAFRSRGPACRIYMSGYSFWNKE